MPGETFIGAPWRQPYTAKQLSDAAANQVPIIGTNGNFWRWDIESGQYVDTGVLAGAGLADGQVITPKLADGSVTWPKLSVDARPSRRNLLDNAWWANKDAIIDQRGGYIVPAGTPYYQLGISNPPVAGTLTAPARVTRFSSVNNAPIFVLNDVEYFSNIGTAVRGYCQAGYTIDRWAAYSGTPTITLLPNGVQQSVGDWGQKMEASKFSSGIYTGSVLTADGNLGTITFELSGSTDTEYLHASIPGVDGYIRIIKNWFAGIHLFYLQVNSGEVIWSAAKLEPGDHQTLAYQSAEGGWILNDPAPNVADELMRCQRYQVVYGGKPDGAYSIFLGVGTIDGPGSDGFYTGQGFINLPVPMRGNGPTLTGLVFYSVDINASIAVTNQWIDVDKLRINYRINANSGLTANRVGFIYIMGNTKLIIDNNI